MYIIRFLATQGLITAFIFLLNHYVCFFVFYIICCCLLSLSFLPYLYSTYVTSSEFLRHVTSDVNGGSLVILKTLITWKIGFFLGRYASASFNISSEYEAYRAVQVLLFRVDANPVTAHTVFLYLPLSRGLLPNYSFATAYRLIQKLHYISSPFFWFIHAGLALDLADTSRLKQYRIFAIVVSINK